MKIFCVGANDVTLKDKGNLTNLPLSSSLENPFKRVYKSPLFIEAGKLLCTYQLDGLAQSGICANCAIDPHEVHQKYSDRLSIHLSNLPFVPAEVSLEIYDYWLGILPPLATNVFLKNEAKTCYQQYVRFITGEGEPFVAGYTHEDRYYLLGLPENTLVNDKQSIGELFYG